MHRTTLIAGRIGALILGLFLGVGGTAPAVAESPVDLPDPAPLFAASLWDVNDKPFALDQLRGRPLIVNFWARWCAPCRVEIPELVAAHRRLKDQGLVVVGIGLEDRAATVREFAAVYEMEYLVLLAKDQGIALLQALGNPKAGMPYTLAIDRDGRVLARKLGPITKAELDAAIALLLPKS